MLMLVSNFVLKIGGDMRVKLVFNARDVRECNEGIVWGQSREHYNLFNLVC